MISGTNSLPTGVNPEQLEAKKNQDAEALNKQEAAKAAQSTQAPKAGTTAPVDTVTISDTAAAKHAAAQAAAKDTTSGTEATAPAAPEIPAQEDPKITNLKRTIKELKQDLSGSVGDARAEIDKNLRTEQANLKRLEDQAAAAAG